jgi:hypothetical protein
MNIPFLPLLIVTSAVLSVPSYADWNPQVYNAIKWTTPNQGQRTLAYTTSVGITRIPMAYHGGVDSNASGDITDRNKEHFQQWVQERLPSNYCGPVVMDYEQPWWEALGAKAIAPEKLQEIIAVYNESTSIARSMLPNAQWGYWGLPLLRNTSDNWLNQGNSLEPLLSTCGALYPDIYDSNRGKDTSSRAQRHIERVLELAAGAIPVYVFVSPRFTGEGKDHSNFVPDDVFLRHLNGAMKASWTDASEVQHKIQGLILWDAYGYTQASEWTDLDTKHAYYFQLMQALVDAWGKSMKATDVQTGVDQKAACQYGLPEPANSGGAIDDASLSSQNRLKPQKDPRNRERPVLEDERVPSGRVPSVRE